MSRQPVPFAPEALESIRRAFHLAADRRHDLVSLEHLLRALLDDPSASEVLRACGVQLHDLAASLDEVLASAFAPMPGRKPVKPESTVGFDRVVERAVVHAAVIALGNIARVPQTHIHLTRLKGTARHARF